MARSWFVTLSLIAVLATITVGVILWHAVELSSIAAVSERLDRVKPLMNGLRIGVIALLAIYWVVPPSSDSPSTNEITQSRRPTLRRRVIGWMFVIELMIGQNLAGRFVGVLVT